MKDRRNGCCQKRSKVLEVALAMEAAEQNVKDQGHDDTEGAGVHGNPVHRLADKNPRSNPQGGVTCYRHKPFDCFYRNPTYRECDKEGHIARACKDKLRQQSGPPQAQRPGNQRRQTHRRAHHLDSKVEEENEAPEYNAMYNVTAKKAKPITVMVKMNGKEVQMEVDTGASMSIISDSTYHTLQMTPTNPVLQGTDVKLTTYTGENVPVLARSDLKAGSSDLSTGIAAHGPESRSCQGGTSTN